MVLIVINLYMVFKFMDDEYIKIKYIILKFILVDDWGGKEILLFE